MYKFWQERDWNCALLVPQIHIFFYEKKGCPLVTIRIIRPKRAWNYALEKGLKLCIYGPRNTHSLMKWRAAPSQPPEIIYFCKFRPKRTWNYAYLACKIIFLGNGSQELEIHILLWPPEVIYFWWSQGATRNYIFL